jgi:alkylhydroperoxidase family enzyme
MRQSADEERGRLLSVIRDQQAVLEERERQLEALRGELRQQLSAGAEDLAAREREVRAAEARVAAQGEELRRAQEGSAALGERQRRLDAREGELAALAARLERDAQQLASVRTSLQLGGGCAWRQAAPSACNHSQQCKSLSL